jgi:hypothetical protein
VHAGSEDSYYTFIEFLRIIILRYHSVKLETEHQTCLDKDVADFPEFTRDEEKYVKHCEMRLSRNVAGVPFSPQISKE